MYVYYLFGGKTHLKKLGTKPRGKEGRYALTTKCGKQLTDTARWSTQWPPTISACKHCFPRW